MKKFKMEKKYMWIAIAAVVVLTAAITILLLCIKSPSSPSATSSAEPASLDVVSDAAASSDALVQDITVSAQDTAVANDQNLTPEQTQQTETKAKYEDVAIYERDGKKYAKTESGTEVELSGENLQRLMTEYVLVQGTGSEKEKELLDQMQVILDNTDVFSE